MKENTRESILNASEQLFARYGYKKTTVDDIAREAGIGKGTVYLYFKGKEDVAIGVVDRANRLILDRIMAIADQDLPSEQKLRKMLIARVMARFDGIQAYIDSLDDFIARSRPAYMEWRRKMLQAEVDIFCKALLEGRSQGLFEIEDAFVVAHAMLVSTMALMPFELARADLANRAEVESMAETIADLMLHGIIPATSRPISICNQREQHNG
jgi:AcrR family transcriptional regulator